MSEKFNSQGNRTNTLGFTDGEFEKMVSEPTEYNEEELRKISSEQPGVNGEQSTGQRKERKNKETTKRAIAAVLATKGNNRKRKNRYVILTIVLVVLVIGATYIFNSFSDKFDIVGMWKDTNGTIRTFSSDGTCLNVAKIDIGGSSPTYTLSEKKDSDNYYLLSVQQGGYNQTTFYVKVISDDKIEIYESESVTTPLYSLTKQ